MMGIFFRKFTRNFSRLFGVCIGIHILSKVLSLFSNTQTYFHFEYVIPPETEIQNMFLKEMVPRIEMVIVDDIIYDAMMWMPRCRIFWKDFFSECVVNNVHLTVINRITEPINEIPKTIPFVFNPADPAEE